MVLEHALQNGPKRVKLLSTFNESFLKHCGINIGWFKMLIQVRVVSLMGITCGVMKEK